MQSSHNSTIMQIEADISAMSDVYRIGKLKTSKKKI